MMKVCEGRKRIVKRYSKETATVQRTESLILDSIADSVGRIDRLGNILYINNGFQRIRHMIRDFMKIDITEGHNIFDILEKVSFSSLEVYDRVFSGFYSVIREDGELFQHEFFWDSTQGRLWFEIVVRPLAERECGSVITLTDITGRKNTENQLIESKGRYRKLTESIPDAVLITIDDEIVYANPAGSRMFEYESSKDLVGESIFKLIHSDFHDVAKERIRVVQKEQGRVPLVEQKIVTKLGRVLDVEISTMLYSYDSIPSSMLVLRDITERKQSEILRKNIRENERLLKEAYEYDRLKNEFIANVSHELRTPINVILSGLQILEVIYKKEPEEENRLQPVRYTNMMKQNCYRLLRLISNLIDISKIEAGFFELNEKNFNIVSIIEDICMSVSDYIESHGLQLEFDTEVEERIMACDPDKIERVMLNLLSNAVKFSNRGGKITVNVIDRYDSVEVRVKDTGIGIPEDKKELLFQRFRQINPSLVRNRQGSGIGLSLVKSLIELHSGTITVESKYGCGTEFIFNLPVRVLDEEIAKVDGIQDYQSKIERINIEFSDVYSL